ncbi:MAG: Ig-like domain-containing protein [Anaerolineae bacterium]|nr:Ig-like domain-containing protein [Anaerolineae bacterium]
MRSGVLSRWLFFATFLLLCVVSLVPFVLPAAQAQAAFFSAESAGRIDRGVLPAGPPASAIAAVMAALDPNVSQITVTSPHVADGSDAAFITVRVIDTVGMPVAGASVWLRAGGVGGAFALEMGTTDASGYFTTTLTSTRPGRAIVSALISDGTDWLWIPVSPQVEFTGASVSGAVYFDANGDGEQNGAEPGIGGVQLGLYYPSQAMPLKSTLAADDGQYRFTGLLAGTYRIAPVLLGQYAFGDTGALTVTLGDFTSATGQDFGAYATARVEGHVFVDANQDGRRQDGEVPLSGITLRAFDEQAIPVERATSGEDGAYTLHPAAEIPAAPDNFVFNPAPFPLDEPASAGIENHALSYGLLPLGASAYPANYDFETGALSGWTVSSSGTVSVVSNTYNLDGHYLLLNADFVWAQTAAFTVPVNAQSLHFDYFSWRPTGIADDQSLKVEVLTGAGFGVATVIGSVPGSAVDGWQRGGLDLQAFRGRQIKLRFTTAFNGRARIDNVTLNVETPDWTPSDARYVHVMSDTYNLDGAYLLLDANSVWAQTSPFTVPLDAQSVRFDYFSWRPGGGADARSVEVKALSGAGFGVATVIGSVSGSAVDGWKEGILDLQAYRGQQIKLRFTTAYECRARIDDVTLNVETPGWTPSDVRYVHLATQVLPPDPGVASPENPAFDFGLTPLFVNLPNNDFVAGLAPLATTTYPANYNFETGDLSGWTVSAVVAVSVVSDANSLDGPYLLLNADAAWAQTEPFVVPVNAQSVRFDYASWRPSVAGDERLTKVEVLSGAEFEVVTSLGTAPGSADDGWQEAVMDLQIYRGQLVKLRFTAAYDGRARIDNVTLNVETPGWTPSDGRNVHVVSDTHNLDGAYLLLDADSVWAETAPFIVPADAQSVRFDYVSWRPSVTGDERLTKVEALSGAEFEVVTSLGTAPGSADDGWQAVGMDVQTFRGQSIKLRFTAAYDGRARIDNVTLNVETPGWTPSDGRYAHIADVGGIDGAYLLLDKMDIAASSIPFFVPTGTLNLQFDHFNWRESAPGTAVPLYVDVLSGNDFSVSTRTTLNSAYNDGWQPASLNMVNFRGQVVALRFVSGYDAKAKIDNVVLAPGVASWSPVTLTHATPHLQLENGTSIAAVSAPFDIPAGATSLYLDYLAWQDDNANGDGTLYVNVLSGATFTTSTRIGTLNSAYNDGWQSTSLNLASFQGQTVKLRLETTYLSNARVDNVYLRPHLTTPYTITRTFRPNDTPTTPDVVALDAFGGATFVVDFGSFVVDCYRSAIAAAPATVVADGESVAAITVTLRDGNDLPLAGYTIELDAPGAAMTVTQPAQPTDAAGRTVGYVAATYAPQTVPITARAVTENVVLAQSVPVTFIPGRPDPARSSFEVAPVYVVADGVDTAVFTVTLRDAFGNLVAGKEVAVTAQGTAVTVTQYATQTNALGQVIGDVRTSVAQMVPLEGYDVTDGIPLAQTPHVMFSETDPALSSVAVVPAIAPVDAATPPVITVVLRDRDGDPLPNKPVELDTNGAALYLDGVWVSDRVSLGQSGADGSATATLTTTLAGSYALTVYGDGIRLDAQAVVTFTAGAVNPQNSRLWANPLSVPADGASAITVYVAVYDAYHNPVSGTTVVLNAIGSDLVLTQPATRTNALGQVTGDVRSSTVQTATLTATAGGVPLAETAQVSFLGADLRVMKTAPRTALPGERITYTLLLNNEGVLPAPGVVATDTLPTALSYVTHTAAFPVTLAGQNVVWDVGNLSPGAPVQFALVAEVDQNAPLYSKQTNRVVVAATVPELDTADNASSASTTVRPRRPELHITPGYTLLAMQPGTATSLAMVMQNTGTGVVSDALLMAPAHIPWITLPPATAHDLQPGESSAHTLALSPPAGLALGTYRDLVKATSTNAGTRDAGVAVRIVGVTRTLSLAARDGGAPVGAAEVRLVQQDTRLLVTEGITKTVHEQWELRTDASGVALFDALETGIYDYLITAPGYRAAGGAITVTEGAGVQFATATLNGLPRLSPEPLYPEIYVRPGETGAVEVALSNVGLNGATNVRVVSPALPWLYAGVSGPADRLEPGQSLTIALFAQPPVTLTTPAMVRQYVDIIADDAGATRVALTIYVDDQDTGILQLQVTDADALPLGGAPVTLLRQQPTLIMADGVTQTYYAHFERTSNSGGMVTFEDLPAGMYQYHVSKEGYEDLNQAVEVGAGQTQAATLQMAATPFAATWSVEETEITDVYSVTVTLTYESDRLQVLPVSLMPPCEGGTVSGIVQVRNVSAVTATNVQVSADVPGVSMSLDGTGASLAPNELGAFPFTASVDGDAAGQGRGRVIATSDNVAEGWAPLYVSCSGYGWQWGWAGGNGVGVYSGPHPSFPGLSVPPLNSEYTVIRLAISQKAMLERQAFLATLSLSDPAAPMTGLSISISARDAGGVSRPTHFTITPTVPTAMPDLQPGGDAVSQQWTIVPASLDLTGPAQYSLYATVDFTVDGNTYQVRSLPEVIMVYPQPEVYLEYFVPAFVPAQEWVLLGVRAENRGAGVAKDLRIASAYPQILSQQGPPVSFSMLGTVKNGALAGGSLKLELGDIPPGGVVEGGWALQFSRQGMFKDLGVRCEHLDYQGMALSNLLYCEGSPQVSDTSLQTLCGGECPDLSAADKQGFYGGPINTYSGNYGYQTTDLSLPTRGKPLSLERSYNSQNVFSDTDTLGAGWTHAYAMRLEFPETTVSSTLSLRADNAALDYWTRYYRDAIVVRLPGGSRLRLANNGDGTYTGYPGSQTSLTTQEVGEVVTYTLTAADQTARFFDAAGRLRLIRDRHGNETRLAYNLDGQLVRVTDPAGLRWLDLDYLPLPLEGDPVRLVRVRDSAGRQVQYGYDLHGNLSVMTDTRGLAWTYVYTSATLGGISDVPLLHAIFDPAGSLVERTRYDDAGRAIYQEDGAGIPLTLTYAAHETLVATAGYIHSHRYDLFGTLVEVVDTAGQSESRIYDRDFRPAQSTDALGRSTQMLWSPGCGLLGVITDTLGQVTTITYDERNNPTAHIDAARRQTRYVYNEDNLLIGQTNALTQSTTYAYDAYGQLISTTTAAGETTRYAYDAWGQRTVVTDAAGLATRYGYDTAGRLITTTTPTGLVTVNEYDAGGYLLRATRNVTTAGGQNYRGLYNQVTAYAYDLAGRRTHVTDTLGFVTRSWYNAGGQLLGSTRNYSPSLALAEHGPDNAWNLSTWYGYDALGRQTRVTDTLGFVTYTEYDGEGRVLAVTHNYSPVLYPNHGSDQAWNLRTEYAYDAVGNRTYVTGTAPSETAMGSVTYTEYDALNRIARVWQNYLPGHPQNWQNTYNLMTEYGYDAVGNQVWVTDTLGRVTRTEYNALDRPVRTVTNYHDGAFDPAYPDEDVVEMTVYDPATGRQIARLDAAEHATRTDYDAAGRPVTVTTHYVDGIFDPSRPDEDIQQVTYYDPKTGWMTSRWNLAESAIPAWYEYDVLGRLITTTNALSGATTTRYDVLGRRTVTSGANGDIAYRYDAAGRLVKTRTVSGTTTTRYDVLGRRIAETNALGHTTVYTYDAAGRLAAQADPLGGVTIYAYNVLGRRIAQTDADGVSTYFVYDDAGRLSSTCDALGSCVRYAYDALGLRVAQTDARGVTTRYAYDALGRLVAVVENYVPGGPLDAQTNVRTEYTYDVSGNRLQVADALGRVTRYAYDALNRSRVVTDALGYITRYGYDGHGRQTSAVFPDAGGPITVTLAYNALNLPVMGTYPGVGASPAFTVTLDYTALGHRTGITDAVGVMTYDYDALYRPVGIAAPTGAAQYRYDAQGQRTHLVYPGGEVVVYVHDAAGRLRTVTDWDGQTTVYTYTAAGRLQTLQLPNGIRSEYAYDIAGRLVEIVHRRGETLLAHYVYTLDAAGNRVQAVETFPESGEPEGVRIYLPLVLRGYDSQARSAGSAPAVLKTPNATHVISYTYDALQRLIAADYSTGEAFAYTYDAVGNRIAMTVTLPLSGTAVTVYEYDAANRLTTAQSPGSGIRTYTWDARGNLIHDGTFAYTFDAAGQLVRAEAPNFTAVYTYSAENLRVAQSVNGVVTEFVWDWGAGLPEMLAQATGSQSDLYLFGHDTLGWWDSDSWAYYLLDALGSVRQTVDGMGMLLATREWTPYGEEIGGAQTGLGYTGEWFDANVDLQYLRARWYDPATGRFTQEDLWQGDGERPQTLNLYGYVENNPIMWLDSSGLVRMMVVRGADAANPEGLAVRAMPSVQGKLLRRIHDGTQVVTWEDTPIQGWNGDAYSWYSLLKIDGEFVPLLPFAWHAAWSVSNYLVDAITSPSSPEPSVNPSLAGFRLGSLFQSEDGTILDYEIINNYGSDKGFPSWLPDLGRDGHNGVDLVAVPKVTENPCEDNVAGRRVLVPVDGVLSISNPDVCDEYDAQGVCIKVGHDPENPYGITSIITQIPNYPELEVQLSHVYPHHDAGAVQCGAILGYYAKIGYSSTPHLHITMKWNKSIFNPEPYLP